MLRSRLVPLGAALLTLLGVATASAGQPLRYTGKLTYHGPIELPRGSLEGEFIFDVRFGLSALMGEPVVDCAARWTHDGVRLKARLPQVENQIALNDAQIEQIELYGLELRLTPFNSVAPDARIYCDAGIVGHGDRKPFNVAGSPEWDRFVCRGTYSDEHKCDEEPGVYWAQEDDAKAIMKSIVEGSGDGRLAVHRVRANAGDLVAAQIEAQAIEGLTSLMEELIAESSDAASEHTGETVDFVGEIRSDPRWEQADPLDRLQVLAGYQEMLTHPDVMREVGMGEDFVAAVAPATEALRARQEEEVKAAVELFDQWQEEAQRIAETSDTALAEYRAALKPSIRTGSKGPFAFAERMGEAYGYGFRDSSGKVVLAPRVEWEKAWDFHDGLALVKGPDGSYHYVDPSGERVVAGVLGKTLVEARSFADGVAPMTLKNSDHAHTWYLVDTKGGVVKELKAVRIYEFHSGRAAMDAGGYPREWYYIDASGQPVLGPYKTGLQAFSSAGYAVLGDAVIDVDGNVLSNGWREPVILAAKYLRERRDAGYGVIDIATNREIVPFEPGNIGWDRRDGAVVFVRSLETSLAREKATCREDGWEKFRTDMTVYAETGTPIDRSSENGERTLPVGICLHATPVR